MLALLETKLDPKAFFVTDKTFYVDGDLEEFVDLSPCRDDTRRLSLLVKLQQHMSEEAIAAQCGGLYGLYLRHATLPQLMHEITRYRCGEESILNHGPDCFMYLEGRLATLRLVYLYFNGPRLHLNIFKYRQYGVLQPGYCLYGN